MTRNEARRDWWTGLILSILVAFVLAALADLLLMGIR